jgi:predicted nucleic acid-binding protein
VLPVPRQAIQRLGVDDIAAPCPCRFRGLIRALAGRASLVAPAPTLGELFVVLRRSGTPPEDVRTILVEFATAFGTSASEARTALAAADLVVDHKLQFWDALTVTAAAAADAGCTLLLSEKMRDGFVTRGLTVVSPLPTPRHPKLAKLLSVQHRIERSMADRGRCG